MDVAGASTNTVLLGRAKSVTVDACGAITVVERDRSALVVIVLLSGAYTYTCEDMPDLSHVITTLCWLTNTPELELINRSYMCLFLQRHRTCECEVIPSASDR